MEELRKQIEENREQGRAERLQECSKRLSYYSYSAYFLFSSALISEMHTKSRFQGATDMSAEPVLSIFYPPKINDHQCRPFTTDTASDDIAYLIINCG